MAARAEEPKMIRRTLLGMVLALVGPAAAFAQMGGMGGGMAPGIPRPAATAVTVDLEGGLTIEGTFRVPSIQVESPVGRYELEPAKIRSIRFERPKEQSPGPYNPYLVWPGTVTVSSGLEIKGDITVEGWKFETKVGSLTPKGSMIREMRFSTGGQAVAGGKLGSKTLVEDRAAKNGEQIGKQRDFRMNGLILSGVTVDGKVSMLDLETRKRERFRLQEVGDGPMEIVPIDGGNLVALMLTGPKIRRVAVYDRAAGQWYPKELGEVVDGKASPVMNLQVVAYAVGQRVYAYSAAARRWDAVELPKGVPATPIVFPNSVKIECSDQIYTFKGNTGRWEHTDIRALLEAPEDEPKAKAGDRKP
jgi:hypothetical protein